MKAYLIIALLSPFTFLHSQSLSVKGQITDENKQYVDYATVILNDSAGNYCDAVLTDSLGIYFFPRHLKYGKYMLVVKHLLYESDTTYFLPNNSPIDIILRLKRYSLDEVQIMGEKPQMKIEGNTLSYNASIIKQNNAISNAYDLIKEIPGIMEIGGNISLAGSEKLNIIINGQTSSMTLSQVSNMLRNMPITNIKNIDVMYNPPSKYNVKGALINIILDKGSKEQPLFTGELSLSYKQSYYASNSERVNLRYSKNKLSIDVWGDINSGKDWSKNSSHSVHYLKDKKVLIDEHQTDRGNDFGYDFRVGADYQFSKETSLILSYYLSKNKENRKDYAINDFVEDQSYRIESLNRIKDREQLHNANAKYLNKDFSFALEYTFYKNPTNQHYKDSKYDVVRNDYLNNSNQKVSQWSTNISHSIKTSKKMNIGYGLNLGYNYSNTQIHYLFKDASLSYIEDENMRILGKQEEYIASPYLDVSYKINDKVSTSASLRIEYFTTDYTKNGIKSNLWNDWTVFPKFSLTYNQSSRSTLQLNFSSDKKYPSFWAINPQTTELNSSSQVIGNPELKPSKLYRGQVMYIRDRKYFIIGFIQYTPNYFTQLPHMSDDELKTIYRFENYDYLMRMGMTIIATIKKGKFFSSRASFHGMRTQEKIDDFYGEKFNYKSYSGVVMLNNSFNLSEKILLQINGHYQSKARQGVYKLGEIWKLTGRLKWSIDKNMELLLDYDNILKHQMPRPIKFEHNNQYKTTKHFEKSSFGLTLLWKFGNYKKANFEDVDKSRLSK